MKFAYLRRRFVLFLASFICFYFVKVTYLRHHRTKVLHSEKKSNRTCIRKHNIFFLKIQKCGSTTLQNILLRFADLNNLSVALPDSHFFNRGRILEDLHQPSSTLNHKYNIFCFHCFFQEKVVRNLMPQDAVYLTMLRDPMPRFISSFMWFKRVMAFQKKKTVDQFISKTLKRKKPLELWRDTNKMLDYLGFIKQEYNIDALPAYLDHLHSTFHLVMIMEHFEESLILMKHLLCWKTDDLVFVVLNTRVKKGNDTYVSEKNKRFLQTKSKGDHILYEFFVAKLKQKIEKFGKTRMINEISQLRKRLSYWQHRCIAKTGTKKNISANKVHKHWRDDTYIYELTKEGQADPVCMRMIIPEKNYRVILQQKQAAMIEQRYLYPP